MANFLECAERKDDLMGHLMGVAASIAKDKGLDKTGFRIVTNCGKDAMQSVGHFHIHLLGGGQLSAEMG